MGTRIYVGNLPFDADENALRELFGQGGRKVVDVKLVTDRVTGQPRGFAFVEMGSEADAQAAIRELNGKDFGGRSLRVDVASERPDSGGRPPRSSGPGGGREGRGGGGGRRGY
jgi:RNA recognition motif-containing protein